MPQATLSRRLKKLNIAKIQGRYQLLTPAPAHLPLVLGYQTSELGLLVLYTPPCNASALAAFIDHKYISHSPTPSGIIGTIAGDDTVLVILKSQALLASVLTQLQQDFPYLSLFSGKSP